MGGKREKTKGERMGERGRERQEGKREEGRECLQAGRTACVAACC